MAGRAKKKRVRKRTSDTLDQPGESDSQEGDETIRLVKDALEREDLGRLRQLAATKGLVNNELRRRCWHLMLGVDAGTPDPAHYQQCHGTEHADSRVVAVDVQRSLWSFTPGMTGMTGISKLGMLPIAIKPSASHNEDKRRIVTQRGTSF
eukprot:gene7894-1104_t